LTLLCGFQTTDENWQEAEIKEAAAVIFKVSALPKDLITAYSDITA